MKSLSNALRFDWKGVFVSAIAMLLTVSLVSSVHAETVIFEEDFDSYDEGSNLFGQGGWVHDPLDNPLAVDVTIVGVGAGLGSMCSNGRLNPGHSKVAMAVNLCLTPSLDQVYTLSFDAYAYSRDGQVPSHDTSVSFHSSNESNASGWWTSNNPAQQVPSPAFEGWMFDARYLGGGDTQNPNDDRLEFFGMGCDKPVSLTTIVDPINGEIYGIADFGSDGTVETQHFPLDLELFLNIDGLLLFQDYRWPCYGGEIDNIKVTAAGSDSGPDPEPDPEPEPADAVFDDNSATITHTYQPGKVGDKLTYAWTGIYEGHDLSEYDYEVRHEGLRTEIVDGVICLKYERAWYYQSEKLEENLDQLWAAQDTHGNVWVLKEYDADNNETKYYGKDNAILGWSFSPAVGETYEGDPDDGIYGIVEAIGVTVPKLSTGLGPWTNCLQLDFYEGDECIQTQYYALGVGMVFLQWHDEGTLALELKAVVRAEDNRDTSSDSGGGGGGGGCFIGTAADNR